MIDLLAALALSATSPSAPVQTGPLDFMLHNHTSETVVQIFISVPSTDSWEEDILGSDVVPSGESVHITIDDGLEDCEYDIKVVFDDETPDLMVMGVDFCAVNGDELTLNDGE